MKIIGNFQINSNRDNLASWDEFVSYLLLGFQNNDPSNQKETMQQPITGHPVVINSHHRLPVIRIQYCPTVMPVRITVFLIIIIFAVNDNIFEVNIFRTEQQVIQKEVT